MSRSEGTFSLQLVSSRYTGTRPTCAFHRRATTTRPAIRTETFSHSPAALRNGSTGRRSEERRVGKECRSRWGPGHEKKKKQNTSNNGATTTTASYSVSERQ